MVHPGRHSLEPSHGQCRLHARIGFASTVFNPAGSGPGQMWVVGGQDVNGNSLGDVWTAPLLGFTPAITPTPTFTISPTSTPTGDFDAFWDQHPQLHADSFAYGNGDPGDGKSWFAASPPNATFQSTGQTATVFNGAIWVLNYFNRFRKCSGQHCGFAGWRQLDHVHFARSLCQPHRTGGGQFQRAVMGYGGQFAGYRGFRC